ncbi:MAG: type IV conjugative transfer system protein TraE [Pseudomonadota bacterium]
MDSNVSYARLNTALRQRNMLAFSALVLSLAIVLLAYALATKEERIILTPTLLADTELTTRVPSPEYLEQVTRDISNLFLNRHPHNLSYFRENILRLSDPTAHGQIEAALMATERRLLATRTSTVFYPTEIFVDPERLYSEIKGELHTYLGPERVSEDRKIYAADWSYRSMRLHLQDFYPIEADDAVATTTALTRTTETEQ